MIDRIIADLATDETLAYLSHLTPLQMTVIAAGVGFSALIVRLVRMAFRSHNTLM